MSLTVKICIDNRVIFEQELHEHNVLESMTFINPNTQIRTTRQFANNQGFTISPFGKEVTNGRDGKSPA